jgi:hypothetical protein
VVFARQCVHWYQAWWVFQSDRSGRERMSNKGLQPSLFYEIRSCDRQSRPRLNDMRADFIG